MSETVPTPSATTTTTTPTSPVIEAQKASDSLWSPQFIQANWTNIIVLIVVCSVLWSADDGNIKLVLGFVFGIGYASNQFYFGTSKSGAVKDAVIASGPALPPLLQTTTTTTGTPTT